MYIIYNPLIFSSLSFVNLKNYSKVTLPTFAVKYNPLSLSLSPPSVCASLPFSYPLWRKQNRVVGEHFQRFSAVISIKIYTNVFAEMQNTIN